MPPESTLRRRLTTAFVLLALVIGGVFWVAGYFIVKTIENDVIGDRLDYAAPDAGEVWAGRIPDPPRTRMTIAVGDQVPAGVRALPAGRHEIETGERVLHVLVGDYGGQPFVVMEDTTNFDRIETAAFTGLALAVVAGVMLALALARTSVNRTIAPLTRLATAVEQDELPAQSSLLRAEDEIGVLARAFEARTNQLSGFLARERLFTGDVSHELRTPLTVISGAAELLAARLAGTPELHAAAERIQRASADAAVSVSALLQLARSPEKLEETRFSLHDLVAGEIEKCRPLLAGKPVEIAFASPRDVRIEAAADLAAIAVGNLLRNACTFTERGAVRVELGEDSLVVEDTGPGLPRTVRDHLFEPFVRGHGDRYAGSGLGLSIVKRVTGHLGWAIRLDEPPHGGSRFVLFFRPAPRGAPRRPEGPAP